MKIKIFLMLMSALLVSVGLSGCYASNAEVIKSYHAQHESVQGTQKTTFNKQPRDIVDLQIPLILPNMKSKRALYGDDLYEVLKSRFETSGSYLKLEVMDDPVGQGNIKINTHEANKMNSMIHPFNKSMSVIVRAPDGEELKSYGCNISIEATTTYSPYDRAFKHGAYVREAFALLNYNCWAQLINKMADDENELYELNDKFF